MIPCSWVHLSTLMNPQHLPLLLQITGTRLKMGRIGGGGSVGTGERGLGELGGGASGFQIAGSITGSFTCERYPAKA